VPPGLREDVNDARLASAGHGGQVADHATGRLGQSKLDREGQLLDHVTEATGDLEDDHLTFGAGLDGCYPPLGSGGRVCRGQPAIAVGLTVGPARMLHHDEFFR